ncbi:DUF6059 family protein [Kitasatospora sp. NPDC088351]|uniref:DUF6059 family protein n=1 Tax=unclassified Kitasatospora TaxID=2633591 RepID=UPI003449E324
MRWSLRNLLRLCGNAVITYGQCQIAVSVPQLEEPAPGHPERTLRGRPLTETEKALDRQLDGVAERVGPGLGLF